MHLANYLALLQNSEQQLADALIAIANHHRDEPDIYGTCKLLSSWSQKSLQALQPFIDRYHSQKGEEPERLRQTLFQEPRTGSLALLRDLHDLWLLANEVDLCLTVLMQAAKALRDSELESTCNLLQDQTHRQIAWLIQRIKQAAPQALVVAA
jgi:hypothetical protein